MTEPSSTPPPSSPSDRRLIYVLLGLVAILLVGVTALATALLLGGDDGNETQAPREVAGADTSPTGLELGLWTKPEPSSTWDEVRADWQQITDDLGHPLHIGHEFQAFERDFPRDRLQFHIEAGRTPMLSWNGTDVIEIAQGLHDETIRTQARNVASLEGTVLVRWFWEMDGASRQPRTRDPESYEAAWRHIWNIFGEEGATDVEWVWCPNAFDWEERNTAEWYPGDDVVDWVCADGYNWAPGRPNARWQPLDEIFTEFYAWATGTGKRIMIGEVGVQEREPGEKAQWLADVPSNIREAYPELDAFVYYNEDRTDLGFHDWRLDSSPEAYDSFIAMYRELLGVS